MVSIFVHLAKNFFSFFNYYFRYFKYHNLKINAPYKTISTTHTINVNNEIPNITRKYKTRAIKSTICKIIEPEPLPKYEPADIGTCGVRGILGILSLNNNHLSCIKNFVNFLETIKSLREVIVAPSRFELESQDPESRMIDL